jgi:hypothetical protein
MSAGEVTIGIAGMTPWKGRGLLTVLSGAPKSEPIGYRGEPFVKRRKKVFGSVQDELNT